jgi:hypothetical protein
MAWRAPSPLGGKYPVRTLGANIHTDADYNSTYLLGKFSQLCSVPTFLAPAINFCFLQIYCCGTCRRATSSFCLAIWNAHPPEALLHSDVQAQATKP